MGDLSESLQRVHGAIRTNDILKLEEWFAFKVKSGLSANIYNLIYIAIESEKLEALQFLLEKFETKIPLDLREIILLCCSDTFMLQLLDAEIDITIFENDTPLHRCILRTSTSVAEELIKRGADVNATNFDGYTPMHFTVERGHEEAVCMLLYYDADPNIVTRVTKMTPFMLSLQKSYHNIQHLLIDYVTDFNQINSYRFSTLDLALKNQSCLSTDIVLRGGKFNIDLIFTNIDVFNAAWPMITYKTLSEQRFPLLKKLLFSRKIPYNNFLHYLYTLITCAKYSYYLFEQYLNVQEQLKCTLFADIMECLFEYKVDTENRLSIMYILLSKSIPVFVNDLYYTFKYFGYDVELETFFIINPDVYNDNLFHNFPLFLNFLIFNNIQDCPGVFSDFSTFFKFYAPNENLRRLFWTSVNNFTSYQIPTNSIYNKNIVVASLKQLSRDVVRNVVYKQNKILNFYSVIKHLPVPNVVKDILILKKPLYELDNEHNHL